MGKKKDKASKSKKKSKAPSVVESDTETLMATESIEEPGAESIQYAEQVTAADVMERAAGFVSKPAKWW